MGREVQVALTGMLYCYVNQFLIRRTLTKMSVTLCRRYKVRFLRNPEAPLIYLQRRLYEPLLTSAVQFCIQLDFNRSPRAFHLILVSMRRQQLSAMDRPSS
jgi:hypothetical protein